jgi:hypothetical protein
VRVKDSGSCQLNSSRPEGTSRACVVGDVGSHVHAEALLRVALRRHRSGIARDILPEDLRNLTPQNLTDLDRMVSPLHNFHDGRMIR